MVNHINSASRLIEILKKVKAQQDNEKIFLMWASIFGIENKDYDKINFEIARHLEQLHGEVEIVRNYMLSTNFEAVLYVNYLNLINSILVVDLLRKECRDIKNSISNEVFLSLGFCKYILPDESLLVNADDISELHSLLSSLEASLSESILPDYTKNIIQNNIDRIKSALRSYTIIGAKAFKSATDSFVGEVAANASVFVDANDPETVTKFGQFLRKTISITEKFIKTDNAITAGINFTHYGIKALEFFDKIL